MNSRPLSYQESVLPLNYSGDLIENYVERTNFKKFYVPTTFKFAAQIYYVVGGEGLAPPKSRGRQIYSLLR